MLLCAGCRRMKMEMMKMCRIGVVVYASVLVTHSIEEGGESVSIGVGSDDRVKHELNGGRV